jgi:Spy/CpxP family protein refolding chaperone
MKAKQLMAVAALALAALMAVNASAQDNSTKPERRPRAGAIRPGGGRIAEELGLSAEQKTKFEAVMKDAAEKRKALRDDTSLTPEQRREKGKAIAEDTQKKVKEILTPDQQKKLEDLRKERRGRGPAKEKSADAAK